MKIFTTLLFFACVIARADEPRLADFKKFADEQVEIEKSRRGPYPAAWEFASSMTKKERERKFRDIVSANK